jgi:hypothetical protein
MSSFYDGDIPIKKNKPDSPQIQVEYPYPQKSKIQNFLSIHMMSQVENSTP